jgi:predicted nucleic acid-binding protein
VTYADTSALAKLLIAEAETEALGVYLAAVPDRTTSSELTIAACLSACPCTQASPETADLEYFSL